MSKDNTFCSFCGREKKDTNMLIAGLQGHICDYCVTQATLILNEEQTKKKVKSTPSFKLLKPIEPEWNLVEHSRRNPKLHRNTPPGAHSVPAKSHLNRSSGFREHFPHTFIFSI